MTQEQTQIPRYDYRINYDYSGGWVEFEQTEDGDYCLWSDVEAELNRLRQEIKQLRAEGQTAEWAHYPWANVGQEN